MPSWLQRFITVDPANPRAAYTRWGLTAFAVVVVVAVLFVPPFSLVQRVFHTDYAPITPANGGSTSLGELAVVQVAPGGTSGRGRFLLTSYSGEQLAALSADSPERSMLSELPAEVIGRGALYRLLMSGTQPTTATITLPLPADLTPPHLADLYAWDGSSWRWQPSQPTTDGRALTSTSVPLYTAYLVTQAQPQPLRLIELGADAAEADSVIRYRVTPPTILNADGSLAELPKAPVAADDVLLSIDTTKAGLPALLGDAAKQPALITELQVAAQTYGGLELQLAADTATDPTLPDFIGELADNLRTQNKTLALRLDLESASKAAQLASLAAKADLVNAAMPADPRVLDESALSGALRALTQAVDRRKVNLLSSAYSCHLEGDATQPLSYKRALGLLVDDASTENKGIALPSGSLTVTIPALDAAKMQYDAARGLSWFNLPDKSTVWLANRASVLAVTRLASQYALGGVAIDGLHDPENDPTILAALKDVQASVPATAPRYAIVWTVTDRSGKVVIDHITTLVEPKLAWRAPAVPGEYTIRGALSDDGGQTNLGDVANILFRVPSLTATPSPDISATSELNSTPTATETPSGTLTPTPTIDPNATLTPTPEATATPEPTTPPAPVNAPPPSGGSGFGYGIQADFISDGDYARLFGAINELGLRWVKQQVEWFRYNPAPGVYDWGALDRLVDTANANGINVMFSVVKAPSWARPAGDTEQGPPADPATYAAFVGEMAARYRGRVRAYEIWNEQNLYYEWGGRGGKLSAARYVELLAAAYAAIKTNDPNAIVISGALTPTGVTDYDISVDDRLYLEQMYQAGLARYCDAVGIHPSGFNNPPEANWYDWSDSSAPSFKGHPSFFFRSNMEAYRNIMVAYGDGWKKLWVTEFGWASVDGLGVGPAYGYGYAADNSEAEQAAWITTAYRMGANWGWVGPMFLWNLNFAPVSGPSDEKAAFGIVRADWSPRPAYAAIRDMRK
ncbi:MAG: cellulase family glycosylhydrolase [Chloroflexi bacterium]|nr:cellulase family glycosylhydrolase [Chloroflexota bacterium]